VREPGQSLGPHHEPEFASAGSGRADVRNVPFMAALGAAIRKLRTILSAIIRDRRPWQSA